MSKLNSVINTPEMQERIYQAAAASDEFNGKTIDLHYEHGQWWVCCDDGSQYSVVDASGGNSIDGFDFEQVTPSDED